MGDCHDQSAYSNIICVNPNGHSNRSRLPEQAAGICLSFFFILWDDIFFCKSRGIVCAFVCADFIQIQAMDKQIVNGTLPSFETFFVFPAGNGDIRIPFYRAEEPICCKTGLVFYGRGVFLKWNS